MADDELLARVRRAISAHQLLPARGPKKSPARTMRTGTPSRDAARRRSSMATRILPLRVTGFCGVDSSTRPGASGPKL